MAKLKVYRTAIGFHDAYVAASSQKAAMAAWGTEKDLFARDAAELVTDPALTAVPLAAPGTVIKLTRGSLKEQLAALGPGPAKARPATKEKPEAATKPKSEPGPEPKPSRAAVEQAEAEFARFEASSQQEFAEFAAREACLAEQRRTAEVRHRQTVVEFKARIARERAKYQAKLRDWSG